MCGVSKSECGGASRVGQAEGGPEVGFFWMSRDGRQFYKRSVVLEDADDYGDAKMLDVSHDEEWASVIDRYPAWGSLEYFEVPRGRVVFSGAPGKQRFVVFLPVELRRFAKKIAKAFGLPPQSVDFDYSDLHYRLEPDLDGEW